MGHKVAMSICFALGVVQTFFFNKNWSFSYRANGIGTFLRYVAAYGSAYMINLVALIVLVDTLNFPHRLVQGLTILLLAGYLFLLQRMWVFSDKGRAK